MTITQSLLSWRYSNDKIIHLPPRFRARVFILIAVAILTLLLSTASSSFAGSATWKQNPVTGDWNTATNWTTGGPPNGPADTATFGLSNTTGISLSASAEVSELVFNVGASAFTITATPTLTLTISGGGITNNSGITQHFVVDQDESANSRGIRFTNSATAGTATAFSMFGGVGPYGTGGVTTFLNSSSADHATFEIFGATNDAFSTGEVVFFDNATAGHGTFTTSGGTSTHPSGGYIGFGGSSTAGNGSFINNGGAASGARGGRIFFVGSGSVGIASTAGDGTFTNNGGMVSNAGGGSTQFVANLANPTAAKGTFTNNAGTVSGARGGGTMFSSGDAGNATLIANGGPGDGGFIHFTGYPIGGTARVEVFGNGNLDISRFSGSPVNDTIGSIEGDGLAFLGANNLTVGSNNLNTTFSGLIQDGGLSGGTGGSLTKIGTGKLVLRHRNTYTGGTTINGGKLVVNNKKGSGTGTGPVQVNRGRLGGTGTIAGDVTVGDGSGRGAALSPGNSALTRGTLTLQSTLTFNSDAAYHFWLNTSEVTADEVVALGVTINSGAQFSFSDFGGGILTVGTVFTVINNTATTPIVGTFSNLADGATFTNNGNSYKVNYQGGNGNDLTLKVQ